MRAARGLAASLAGVSLTAAPARALVDTDGRPVPDTGPPRAQLVSGPAVVRVLADPATPAGDDPAAVAALASPGDPEGDLVAALDELAGAPDRAAAARARQLGLDILEGNEIAGKAYSGIPLLNWNAPQKVVTVPAGGNVTVREIRFGEHAISDTCAPRFADPAQPFTITYRVAELGYTGIGGILTPTPLLQDGTTPIGGLNSVLEPLDVPLLPTGTLDSSRFHPSASEVSRLALQDVVVRMPPAGTIAAVLDPNLRPQRMTMATLAPATPERLAAAGAAFGSDAGPVTDARKVAAIDRIGDTAPEKQIWVDLRNLDPGRARFLVDAHAVGRDDRVLAFAMQTRSAPPSGVPDTATAQIEMVLLNGEPYVWTGGEALAPGGTLTIAVTNADKYARELSVVGLDHSAPVGSTGLDFGQFAWSRLDLGRDATLAPGATRTFTVTPAPQTFAIALGDLDHGDQGVTLCRIGSGGEITCPSDGVGSVRPPARPITPLATRPAAPQGPVGLAPGPLGVAERVACGARAWTYTSSRARRVLLLGFTPAQVTACLGAPARRTRRSLRETWTYRGGLTVRFGRGHVQAFVLTGRALRSGRGRVTVGSRIAALSPALGGRRVAYDRRLHVYRAVVRQSATVYADLKIGRSRRQPYRVSRIGAAMRSMRQLDRVGRRLARAKRGG